MFDCGGFCLWGQVGIQVVAAALVVIPILAAFGKERDRARSTTQFAIDQFDETTETVGNGRAISLKSSTTNSLKLTLPVAEAPPLRVAVKVTLLPTVEVPLPVMATVGAA